MSFAFDSNLIGELKAIRGLIMLAGAQLDLQPTPFAFMSDSSMQGFAIHVTPISENEFFTNFPEPFVKE